MTTLTISNQTLRYGQQVFSVHNITQIRVDPWKRKPTFSNGFMLLLLFLGWLLFYASPLFLQNLFNNTFSTHLNYPPGLYIMIGAGSLALLCYGIWDRFHLKRYTLFLETASGSSKLFSSPDQKSIEKIASAIHYVMENRHTPIKYTVNIDQSKITLGDEFSNIGDSATIINRSHTKSR